MGTRAKKTLRQIRHLVAAALLVEAAQDLRPLRSKIIENRPEEACGDS
jgi:hypothetical protein